MTSSNFEQHRQTWLNEWNDQWRLLDIDFETYMYMKYNINSEEFHKLNKTNEDWVDSFI